MNIFTVSCRKDQNLRKGLCCHCTQQSYIKHLLWFHWYADIIAKNNNLAVFFFFETFRSKKHFCIYDLIWLLFGIYASILLCFGHFDLFIRFWTFFRAFLLILAFFTFCGILAFFYTDSNPRPPLFKCHTTQAISHRTSVWKLLMIFIWKSCSFDSRSSVLQRATLITSLTFQSKVIKLFSTETSSS